MTVEDNTINITVEGAAIKGDAGPGVPTGGAEGQALIKSSNSDYATEWGDVAPAGAGKWRKLVEHTVQEDVTSLSFDAAFEGQTYDELHIIVTFVAQEDTSVFVDFGNVGIPDTSNRVVSMRANARTNGPMITVIEATVGGLVYSFQTNEYGPAGASAFVRLYTSADPLYVPTGQYKGFGLRARTWIDRSYCIKAGAKITAWGR